MTTKVCIVGGGSAQWTPTLVEDFANTPCLEALDLVLLDIDETRVERAGAFARHVADCRPDLDWAVRTTVDPAAAYDGADFVVVCISTGGFASMGRDLEVAERHGAPMPIGDTTGPAGISRSLRNVPVMVGIAREMERACPDAWMLNVTNPMTALCRAVSKETAVPVVGLCHEVTNATFFLSQLLGCGFFDLKVTFGGVNHLPLVTDLTVDGTSRMSDLLDLAEGRADASAPLPLLDQVFGERTFNTGGRVPEEWVETHWTKQAVLDHQQVNFEILRRFGAYPGADSDHTCEFFPWFITEASGWGERWGIDHKTIPLREKHEAEYVTDLERRTASAEIARYRSPEMVAPVVEGLLTGEARTLPLNRPNEGQVAGLPRDVVVESMCTVDGSGIHPGPPVELPPVLLDTVRSVVTAQELTVRAAVEGDGALVLQALLADPFSGRLDYDEVVALRDDMLDSLAPWLPQF
jgi:alpha-galactosidase